MNEATTPEFRAKLADMTIDELQSAKVYYVMHQRYEEAALVKERQDELIKLKEETRNAQFETLFRAAKMLKQQLIDNKVFTEESTELIGLNILLREIETDTTPSAFFPLKPE